MNKIKKIGNNSKVKLASALRYLWQQKRWRYPLLLLLSSPLILWGMHKRIEIFASEYIVVASAKKLPCDTALLLGCTAKIGRWDNLYFLRRIDATVKLYQTGQIKKIIVSGDNSRREYDESTDMKDALVKKGIPATIIHCDYAGFRTLDSVQRAKTVFKAQNFIIISQGFHCERAVFLARKKGLNAWAYFAADPPVVYWQKNFREYLARAIAHWDIAINRQAKFVY